eukprot:4204570-Prymnesium_polylepis.1
MTSRSSSSPVSRLIGYSHACTLPCNAESSARSSADGDEQDDFTFWNHPDSGMREAAKRAATCARRSFT